MNPFLYIDKNRESLLKTFQELHALAEPSWQEKNTSAYIIEHLTKAGLKVKTFSNHFGIVAEIPGEMEQVVALRADLDALVQEVGGIVQANHSCGHDGHSTMVLYTALAIATSGIVPKHTIRFIFQPAEEKGEGALQMIKEGALKNVVYLFGIHVRPQFEVPYLKASPVIIHGSAGSIRGTIKGLQAHAARPQDGINAIEAASLIVEKIKQIKLDTKIPYSIKMTQLQTHNEASNVIPEKANFSLDVRAQTNEVMNELQNQVKLIFEEIMNITGAKISWSLNDFVPAAIKNSEAINIAAAAITEILGEENLVPLCISQGGEDFHFYTSKTANLQATMVGLGCGLSPGLHHPEMKFQLDALIYGTKILTKAVLLASDLDS
ncbi:amidohydrolase [Neobacillus sp. LXY-4]|uniref:amidohydrolase n=1 Tax=Neobacillus sp. LXY-4 TaxID=3379826 RepID=UPI003EE0BBFF